MTGPLMPLWIIGGPLIGILILSFSFKGPSTMSGGVGLRSDDRNVPQRRTATSL
jgi:hypothetical protein